jgi:hypothetical protein
MEYLFRVPNRFKNSVLDCVEKYSFCLKKKKKKSHFLAYLNSQNIVMSSSYSIKKKKKSVF